MSSGTLVVEVARDTFTINLGKGKLRSTSESNN